MTTTATPSAVTSTGLLPEPREVPIRVLRPGELGAAERAAWETIRRNDGRFDSPYFATGFVDAVAAVRDDVFIAVIEREGRPVGFFPHQRDASGHGLPAGGKLSDFHGVVAADDDRPDAADLLDACGLKSFEFDHLVEASTPAFAAGVHGTASSPIVDLSDGFDAWHGRVRGSSDIRDLARKRRKLERDFGPSEFTLCDGDDDAVEQVFAWKSEQYRRTGLSDVFAFDWTRGLIGELIARRDRGQTPYGCVMSLRVGGRLVAAHVGMRDGATLHYWFPAFDRSLGKYSPGSLLLIEAVAAACDDGITKIDLGKGDERFKQIFGDSAVTLAEGVYARSVWRGSSARFAFAGKRWLKRSPLGAPARYSARILKPWRERRRFR